MGSDLKVTELSPLEQTALLTQYARALDSRWARPILGDTLADDIIGKIDYDFAGLGVPASVVCQSALRAKMLDDRVRVFIAEHPDAVWWTSARVWTRGCFASAHPPRSIGTASTCRLSSHSATG